MTLAEALKIMIDLAADNIVTDPELADERRRQSTALAMLEELWMDVDCNDVAIVPVKSYSGE